MLRLTLIRLFVMTPQQRTRLYDAAVGAVFTIIATVALAILTGAWSGKENAADHRADIAAVRADILRVLDAVCAQTPNIRQCRTELPSP